MDFIKDLNLDKIRNVAEDVYNQAKPKNETEKKVYEVLSHKNWGSSSTLMNDIARDTYDFDKFPIVMRLLWEGTESRPAAWRVVFKALTLLEHLIKNGSERCVDDARNHSHQLRTLYNFNYYEGSVDRGVGVREKSKQITELLGDDERVREERNKAKQIREKFSGMGGIGSDDGGWKSFNNSSGGGGGGGKYEGYGNDDAPKKFEGFGSSNLDDKGFSGRYSDNNESSFGAAKSTGEPAPTFAAIPPEKPKKEKSSTKVKKLKKKKKSEALGDADPLGVAVPKSKSKSSSAPAPAAPVVDLFSFDSAPVPAPAPPAAAEPEPDEFDDFASAPAPAGTFDPFVSAPAPAMAAAGGDFDAFGSNGSKGFDAFPSNGMGGGAMGGAPMGGAPMGGAPMGGMPMSGAPMGGMPMSGAPMGGMPMSGAPMGGMPMGGAPMGSAPMGGMSMGNTQMGQMNPTPQMPTSAPMNPTPVPAAPAPAHDDDFGDFSSSAPPPTTSSDPLSNLIKLDSLEKNKKPQNKINQPIAYNMAAAQAPGFNMTPEERMREDAKYSFYGIDGLKNKPQNLMAEGQDKRTGPVMGGMAQQQQPQQMGQMPGMMMGQGMGGTPQMMGNGNAQMQGLTHGMGNMNVGAQPNMMGMGMGGQMMGGGGMMNPQMQQQQQQQQQMGQNASMGMGMGGQMMGGGGMMNPQMQQQMGQNMGMGGMGGGMGRGMGGQDQSQMGGMMGGQPMGGQGVFR